VEIGPSEVLRRQPRHPYAQGLVSCLLDPRGRQGGLRGIPGQPPDPAHLPGGCHFHPRCPEVMERCRVERPALVPLGAAHLAECHLCS
jgi:oligopeptide/dipeptide ABC transporter ATP-binding protein